MRVDKDQLIKHHFWILLGVFLILWIVSAVLIKTTDVGTKAKADYTAALGSIKAVESKSPKNESFNQPWIEYGNTYKGQKEKVWNDAWEVQKDMFDWPHNSDAQLDRLKYPDDEVKWTERSEYRELWKTQFQKLQAEVAPVEFKGGTGGYVHIMMPGFSGSSTPFSAPIAAGTGARGGPSMGGGGVNVAPVQASPTDTPSGGIWDGFWQHVPTVEEMWLAQEDFWVKRELLRIVRDAVSSIDRFEEVQEDKDKDKPEGIFSRHHFRNSLWDIDFLLEKQGRNQWLISDRSTIKNLHPAGRTVPLSASPTSGGLHFAVKQGNKRVPFSVDGEPLPYGASASFRKKWKIDSITFDRPFELEQEFEAANCPVREIIDIELGKHSHRTNSPLLTSLSIKPPKSDVLAAAGGTTPPPAPQAGAGAGESEFTPNHLPRRRYVFRTEQVRHIPVALHLIVDIAHMHDVLIAMSNSRLRVQTTQVQFRHISGFHPEEAMSSGSSRNVAPDEDPYLVELAVYGLASLYERPPPPPAPTGSPTGAPASAASPPAAAAASPAASAPGKAAQPTTAAAAKPEIAGKTPPTTAAAGKASASPPTTAAAGKAAPPSTAAAPKPGANATPDQAGKAPDAGKAAPPPGPADQGKAPDPAKQPAPPDKSKGTEPKMP
jgi:hypothetical protein